MPFKHLDKLLDRFQSKDNNNNNNNNNNNTPPPIPESSKPAPAHPVVASVTTPASYWQADFSPSAPVSTNFKYELGDGGWGNNELENYVAAKENSFHTPSHELVIRAIIASNRPDNKTKYTSARLTSHQRLERKRGYLEATITAPSATGIWPAFWLLPEEPFKWPTDGEVDIFEAWNGETTNHCCLHWGHFNREDANKHRVVETPIKNLSHKHTYGFAWEQPEDGGGGRCVWYIDGKSVMKAQKPAGTRRFEEWRIILNVAVGGDVCNGQTPSDGCYDLIVHELKMCLGPEGRWQRFDRDWVKTKEGHAM